GKVPVGILQLAIKIEAILVGGDAVIFAARNENRRMNLLRIDNRQVSSHIEVGAGGNAVAEAQLRIRQRISHGGFGSSALITGKNAVDHGPVARAPVMRAIELKLLGAIRACGRTFPRISKSRKDEAVHALGLLHGVSAGAKRAR